MPTAHAAQPAETEDVPLAQSADRREISRRQRFRQRALDKREIKTSDSYLRFFPVIAVAAVAVNEKTFCSIRRICSALQSF